MKYGFFLIVIGFASCTYNSLPTQAFLQGKWVEVSTRTDTLTFKKFGDTEAMYLGRGKETVNGFLLPKQGAGPYKYKLPAGKISLNWFLSSNSAFHDYTFNLTGDKIVVENFYDTGSAGTLQTFERLK